MARITVEDCVTRVPNRFELVMLSAQRARDVSAGASLTVEVMAPVLVDRAAPGIASWGKDRIDIFGRGLDRAAFHKAWAQGWFPAPDAWEALGGGFTGPLRVASWGPDRLDGERILNRRPSYPCRLHPSWRASCPGETSWEGCPGSGGPCGTARERPCGWGRCVVCE